jgi:hypothetical protein
MLARVNQGLFHSAILERPQHRRRLHKIWPYAYDVQDVHRFVNPDRGSKYPRPFAKKDSRFMLKRMVPTLEYRRSSNSKRRRAQEIRRDYVVLLGRTYQCASRSS